MDGTGNLFADFVAELSSAFETTIVSYPPNVFQQPNELTNFIRSALPKSEPFFLLAESYSSPYAIQCASENPTGLKGLILCAGFATEPTARFHRSLISLVSPLVFRSPVPELATVDCFVGSDAKAAIIKAVRKAISAPTPKVLSRRLQESLACDVRTDLAQIKLPILFCCQGRTGSFLHVAFRIRILCRKWKLLPFRGHICCSNASLKNQRR